MALSFPTDCRYADSHEYTRPEGDLARVGISAFAVDQLGDIVFVELPEVGTAVTQGQSFGTVESVKAVEELVAPITGTVKARNEAVLANPEELQNDPWMPPHTKAKSMATDGLAMRYSWRGDPSTYQPS